MVLWGFVRLKKNVVSFLLVTDELRRIRRTRSLIPRDVKNVVVYDSSKSFEDIFFFSYFIFYIVWIRIVKK